MYIPTYPCVVGVEYTTRNDVANFNRMYTRTKLNSKLIQKNKHSDNIKWAINIKQNMGNVNSCSRYASKYVLIIYVPC